ncbi:MAG: hypothetical protein ACR2RB_20375 [Gammaproteobacteria bacterium]
MFPSILMPHCVSKAHSGAFYATLGIEVRNCMRPIDVVAGVRQHKFTVNRARCALALSASLLFTACGGGGGGTDNVPPAQKADVNAAMSTLPDWETFSPTKPSGDDVVVEESPPEPVEEIAGTNKYSCTSTPYDMTETPKEIVMFSPNASIMWLGNLIQGYSYKEGLGSLDELSIRERAPLKISIDLLTAENNRVVENPSHRDERKRQQLTYR